jgi:hypothetical protein
MRPVQLELTNFGPYRKEVINFTQFDHAPPDSLNVGMKLVVGFSIFLDLLIVEVQLLLC